VQNSREIARGKSRHNTLALFHTKKQRNRQLLSIAHKGYLICEMMLNTADCVKEVELDTTSYSS